ncbi:hypothetical protein HDR61_02890 [bacterium]|nr:hypothetical protein [bacterium]
MTTFKGDFTFNLQRALTAYYDPMYVNAYPTTNEPIEQWIPLMPIKNPRVLTVAASGDQPLLHAATGASHIDTFDLTINACAIMDFKTAALQQLNHSEYLETIHLLKHLDGMNSFIFYNKDVSDFIKNSFIQIVNNMPDRTQELMYHLIYQRPDAMQRDSDFTRTFPTNPELYNKIQQTTKKPFNFIWADLMNVSNYIEDKYDIINTSNIFEHYMYDRHHTKADIYITIKKLWPHLNPGGYLLCTAAAPKTILYYQGLEEVLFDMNGDISFPSVPKDNAFYPILIQKTR